MLIKYYLWANFLSIFKIFINWNIMQKENHYEELYDRMVKTSACRFAANDRLRAHHNISLWTITFFSMGLIAIPLIETFGLRTNFSSNYTSFIQVFLAVVVLVISLLLNMASFSVRAEKMHQCGLLVSTLARKVHRHMNEESSSVKYDDFVKDYDNILQRVENHSRVDYLYAKKNLTSHYSNPWYFPIIARFQYLFQFLPYIVLLTIEAVWLFMLVAK